MSTLDCNCRPRTSRSGRINSLNVARTCATRARYNLYFPEILIFFVDNASSHFLPQITRKFCI